MDNTEIFLNTYRELEEALEKRYGQRSGSVARYASGEGYKYYEELTLFREMRNLLSHHGRIDGESCVIPSSAAVAKLTEILEYAENPPIARSVFTPIDQLFLAKETDKVQGLCEIMEKRGYSHLPILNSRGGLKGVFSVGTVFAYGKSNPEKGIGDLKISDLSELTPHYRHTMEKFAFTHPEAPASEIMSIFRFKGPGSRRVAAVFVTSDGSEKGRILGMITPWDLFKAQKEKDKQ